MEADEEERKALTEAEERYRSIAMTSYRRRATTSRLCTLEGRLRAGNIMQSKCCASCCSVHQDWVGQSGSDGLRNLRSLPL